jgi:predicted RNA-binding Zn-ribbon protein involved in translation (DUF1610 family)
MSATARRLPAPDAARLDDLAAELRDAGLRPIIDPELRLVLADCPDCGSQDRCPLGLWRPLQVIPRNGRTWFVCVACGREAIR